MKTENLGKVVEGIRKRAAGMQRFASFFFGTSIGVLIGAAYLFSQVGLPESNESGYETAIAVSFSIFSRLIIVTFAFYVVRIMMSVVTYNLGLSNDLYAKADSLDLYAGSNEVSLKDLREHLEVNYHKFEASKGFSGKEELENLVKIIRVVDSKPNNSSNSDGKNTAAGS